MQSVQNRAQETKILSEPAQDFLDRIGWDSVTCEPISCDASARKYFRLRRKKETAILMDASAAGELVEPFILLGKHLLQLGFSAPTLLHRDGHFLLLEDFGDNTFAALLENPGNENLYGLAVDALIALHKHSGAIPNGLRPYSPEKMLQDIELFLDWCTPSISESGKAEFRRIWREVLPVAHRVPSSLLLRDYHSANLMFLAGREGVRQVGLLDFQDAYQGPVTYDLVSLLEDARRDVPERLQAAMKARYLAAFPDINLNAFLTSVAIVAAQRHTRVLAIFERLSRDQGRHIYKDAHSPRVNSLLHRALNQPALSEMKAWMERYADPRPSSHAGRHYLEAPPKDRVRPLL